MKFKSEDYKHDCDCQIEGFDTGNYSAELDALMHCVSAFADELNIKLLRKIDEGKSGWDDPEWPIEDIKRQLIEHVKKGDFVDVAAFAMFAWNKSD
jgi:hypothetical protein